MPNPRAKVIVNPAAGASSTHRKWPQIRHAMEHSGLDFDYEFTDGRGHAIELAREAASNGYRYLIAVGGDGTLHEIANGMLQTTNSNQTILGVVSTGTGSDLCRSIGKPGRFTGNCLHLISQGRLIIDAGILEFQKNGQKAQRYFVNSAGAGFDAEVVAATEKMPKYFGGTIPYLGGLFRSFLGYRTKQITLETDGRTHLTHPKVLLEKAVSVKLESREKILIHADGELLGEGPASFRVLPRSLTIVV